MVIVPRLRAGRRRHLQIHLQVAHPRQAAQSSGNGLTNLVGNLRLMLGQPDENADVLAFDADILDHAKGNDVAAVTRIRDGLQNVMHLCFGGLLASEHESAFLGVKCLSIIP